MNIFFTFKKLVKLNFYIIGVVFILFLVSCGVKLTTVNFGKISTPDVTITAEDGTFILKSGDSWNPPFYAIPKYDFLQVQQLEINNDIATQYGFALEELNAKKVRVKTPYSNEELFGVILFNKVAEKCKVPVTRSYQITIPEEYVQQAMNGQVSVLYEYYDCSGFSLKTWVLWLSDVPF